MDTNLAYNAWGENEYRSAFGDDLATLLLAHNDGNKQAAAPGTPVIAPQSNPYMTVVVTATAISTTTPAANITPGVATNAVAWDT